MIKADQRAVSVKKSGFSFPFPRRTLALFLVLSLPCYAQEPSKEAKPVAEDAPVVLKYSNGSALMNKAAYDKVDLELKRLQQVEREHKAEPSWVTPILIGGVVGLVVGAVASAVVVGSLKAK